jgi:hypothetical protein
VLLVALATSCNSWEKKLDAKRLEYAASAGQCPAPSTCTDKRHGDGGHDYKVCSGSPGTSFSTGDVVIIHEIGLDMIARVKAPKGDDYTVEFADTFPVTRSKSSMIKRVCVP